MKKSYLETHANPFYGKTLVFCGLVTCIIHFSIAHDRLELIYTYINDIMQGTDKQLLSQHQV